MSDTGTSPADPPAKVAVTIRRFLAKIVVNPIPDNRMLEIEAGYFQPGPPELRICRWNSRSVMIHQETSEDAEGIVTGIDRGGEEIMRRARGRLQFTYIDIGPWRIDSYRGSLYGLNILEIRIPVGTTELPPTPDGIWKIREITGVPEWEPSRLAFLDPAERLALIERVRRDIGR